MSNESQPEKRILRGSVTTCFVLSDRDAQPNWGAQQCYLDEMDPERFADQSMKEDGPVCCSLQGGYGLLIEGIPWNGDNDEDYPGEKDKLHIYYDDLYMALSFPGAIADILKGTRKSGFFYYDECDGYMERVGNREVRIWDKQNDDSEMVVDMIHFGKALLEKGREFQAFSEKLLEIFVQREATESNNHLCRKLNKRIEHIESWQVGNTMDKLERALKNLKLRENGEIIWSDFKMALAGNIPKVTEGKGPYGTYDYFDLIWDNLTEEALLRIQDFLEVHSENGFRWNHPMVKAAKKHWPFRWCLEEDPPHITLKTKAVKPIKPEVMTFMGMFLCLPWDWDKAGKPRKIDQIYIEDATAGEWLNQLRGQEGPLMGNFVIQFHQHILNGEYIHLKEEDDWFRQVKMTSMAEAMEYPRAVLAMYKGAASASWGPHRLSWDDRPEHFLFEMKGWKSKSAVNDMVYGLLHIELELILKKGNELMELAKDEPEILKKLSVLSLDELPEMIATFKTAHKASLKKYKKK